MYPENFRYTKEHEWVLADGDSGTVGITDHAQQEFGDIVYVDLPKVGSTMDAGQIARLGGEREGGVRHLFAGLRRDHRDQRDPGRCAGKIELRSARRRLAGEDSIEQPAERFRI